MQIFSKSTSTNSDSGLIDSELKGDYLIYQIKEMTSYLCIYSGFPGSKLY